MKILVALAFSLITLFSYSQGEITVKTTSEKFSTGYVDAFVVDIYEAKKKDVEKAWKKLMKDYDGSMKMKSEMFCDDATIKRISSNTMDIYAIADDKADGIITLKVAVDLGGSYLSSSQHPDKTAIFSNILKGFAVDASKEAVKEQIKEQQKILDKLVKSKDKLISENENLHKSIENYKQKIVDAEAAIEQNVKDQESTTKEIETQQKVVVEYSEKEKAIK